MEEIRGERTTARYAPRGIVPLLSMLVLSSSVLSCADQDQIPVVVEISGLSVSKLPFVIAADQGLYEKYGLDVELRMRPPPFPGGRQSSPGFWTRVSRRLGVSDPPRSEIQVNGHTPRIVRRAENSGEPDLISVGATDCVMRAHIIGHQGIVSLEDLRGKRLGVTNMRSTTGIVARALAQRMGWDPIQDISIMQDGHQLSMLREGLVDAAIESEMRYAAIKDEGFPILADTVKWNDHLAGNSVLVERR